MKSFKKILLVILTILPALYTAVAVFFILPDTVAAHFGFDGTVNRYGSKYEAFIFPGMILAVGVVYFLIRKYVIKKLAGHPERSARNVDIMDTIFLLILVLLNALCILVLMLMHHAPSVWHAEGLAAVIISAVVGVVFILIGNLMPKTKRNSFVGLRLSFTTDTDEHWYIANRAGGIALMISGIFTVAAGLFTRSTAFIFWMSGALILTLTVAILYSYVKIKGDKKNT